MSVEGTHDLGPVRPNPLTSQARVSLAVSESQRVVVETYDLMGRRIATLLDAEVAADDAQELSLDARALASGTYVLWVRGQTFAETRKVTVVR